MNDCLQKEVRRQALTGGASRPLLAAVVLFLPAEDVQWSRQLCLPHLVGFDAVLVGNATTFPLRR